MTNVLPEENGKLKESSYDEAFELTGHGRYNYLLLVTCCIISNAVALDMFGFSVIVATATCDLRLGITETGILASAPFAGVLFALPWGYYADTQGRRRALLLSTSVGFVFAAATSFSPSWRVMMALKIIGCSFSTSSFTLTMTYLGESVGSKHRSRYLFIMNSMNLASEIVSFGLAYFILPISLHWDVPWIAINYRSWRLFTFIIALPLGIGAFLIFCLYESPKFLINKGETKLTLNVLKKIYIINGGKEEFPVNYLKQNVVESKKEDNILSSLAKQTSPLFKRPLLWRTLQLFYLIIICCTTSVALLPEPVVIFLGINQNYVFVMWFPTMVNLFFNSVSGDAANVGFCEAVIQNISANGISDVEHYTCDDSISPSTIYSGVTLGVVFTVINLITSLLASWRRLVLTMCYLVSAISCIMVGLLKLPMASMMFFALIQTTAVGIGSVASYFVDLYPTSYRGLVTSLGMMAAWMTSFTGVNVIGMVIVDHCKLTFYCWAIFVLSGIAVALFLPSDRKKTENF